MESKNSKVEHLLVTHIEDDGCTFWAQKNLPVSNSDLERVTNQLRSLAKSKCTPTQSMQVLPIVQGEICASQYTDGTWCRCRVLFTIGKTKCLLQYIDYGNCVEKATENLRSLPTDLHEESVPALAQRYRLHDVKICDGFTDNAVQLIESICAKGFLKAELVLIDNEKESHSPKAVILYDIDGTSVAKRLIELGYALEQSGSSSKSKKVNVVLSTPIPQAQLFKNPLLSSSHHGNGDASKGGSNLEFSRSPPSKSTSTAPRSQISESSCDRPVTDNRATCSLCTTYKEIAEMRNLAIIELRNHLEESEQQIAKLKKSELYWKELYNNLKKAQVRGQSVEHGIFEINQDATHSGMLSQSENIQETPTTDRGGDSGKIENITNIPSYSPGIDKKTNFSNSPSKPSSENISTYRPIEESNKNSETWISNEPKDTIDSEELAQLMKKVIMPAFSCFKTVENSNKIVNDSLKYEKEIVEVVEQIKVDVENGQPYVNSNLIGLVTRRNTVVENLKQSLEHAVKILSTNSHELSDTVALHTKALRELSRSRSFSHGAPHANESMNAFDLEKAIKALSTISDLDSVSIMMKTALSFQWEQLYMAKSNLGRFQQTLDDISTYEGQEKLMSNLQIENNSIRKRKQAIRRLVAEVKNLEEDKMDAQPSEQDDLDDQIRSVGEKLSVQRMSIQDSFENKWRFMESLADIVERFCPEWLIEYAGLGVSDFIKEHGLVMKGMEIDHFEINKEGTDECTDAAVYDTVYRDNDITLNKFTVTPADDSYYHALEWISLYSNAFCYHTLLPLGVFTTQGATYVMVTSPPVETVAFSKLVGLTAEEVECILKDIATALHSLHQVGVTHGMISSRCIIYSKESAKAFLLVPNFFVQCDKQSLSKDILQYGSLVKELTQNCNEPNLQKIITLCMNESVGITLQKVLDLF